ncbi:sugar phosphate isomerase/epimerase family protein [Paenibacillus harenae]|uniref:Sugar phosphate isomerase/epimerase n=1 Tax=Paenibacillus harenae TaxID=306543 RepID=A0ABT9U0Q6_PAEHA|nr:sugar phosphate isomerase/epimerase family protein [Paenibacillus harenae]MDQ0059227.1 sugar phosphate isomerase/epimerase [Paenibacillus harenae]MDQ0112691.1 sugar phosphate isomerase/epimerase [Paenibacillus harenae]
MLRGLSGAGLGKLDSDEQFIELAAKYGFQAVDLDARGLIERHGLEGARELLASNGVVIGSIGLPVEWRGSEEMFREGLKELASAAAAAASLGCTSCCTYILPSTDLPAAHFMALATRRLRTCAQVLGAYGIRLGLEFVGPHHLRTRWANPFIWTLQETLDWIDAIGESNVGLLFDAYHWYTNELGPSDIEALRPEQIVHVHINDAPNVPVAEALDNGRVYPGEGVIDLAGFLSSLHKIGYKGPVVQEILSAEAPQGTADSLAERSKAGFDKVYAAAGLQ